MNIPVRPGSFAQDEIEHYLRRYESETPGLGDRLWDEILSVIDLISNYPDIGKSIRRVRGVRRFPLHHFPFVLIYRRRANDIQIVALAHTSRKPNYWRSRLQIE